MKIAFKKIGPLCLKVALGGTFGISAVGLPMGVVAAPAMPAVNSPSVSVASTTPPVLPAAQDHANATPPLIVPPPQAADAAAPPPAAADDKGKDEKSTTSLADAEDKISDETKNVIKHFSTTDNVTLDDLNTARQAVAKIEALIDVEKHLIEFDKLRSEREGGGTRALAGAIPASALSPMPVPKFSPAPSFMPEANMANKPPEMPEGATEVSRIVGGDGHYSATLKMADGQTKQVQVGDSLSGGGKVITISATGVEVEHDGKIRTLHVKNVETVFGDNP